MDTELDGGLPDGFAGDRRIRPAHFFQLDVGLPQRNFIHVWLPEGVSCEHGSLFFVPGGEESGSWENRADGSVRCRRALAHGIEMESVIEEVPYGVSLTVRLTNTSAVALHRVSAHTCVQFAAAPDLRDLGLERTYWRRRGTWQRFEIVSRPQGGRCVFFGHAEPADLPLIVVQSGTGPYAAGLIFRNATSVNGNCQGSIGCIHSNVPAVDIAAGTSAELEGYLVLHPGGRDAVLELATAYWEGAAAGA